MKKALAVIAVVVVVLVALAVLMYLFPFNAGSGSGGSNPSTIPSNTGASTTASPSYPRLESLNGTIVSLDGDEITRELWSRMKDYNASDQAVKPYIVWLRNALATEPHKALSVPWYPRYRYWWFNDRYGWSVPKPSENSVVRIGVVKLPFGAGLIVTAYQDSDGLVVVVHGTIIDQTGWRELVARAYAGSGFNKWYQSQLNKNITVSEGDWVLWRIMLDGHGSKLRVGNAELPIKKVIVLLEMPVYYIYINKYWQKVYSTYLEGAYWDVVGHPALALAIHLAYPPNTDSFTLYSTLVKQLTWRVVLTGTKYSDENNGATPFTVRLTGGYICTGASGSTSMFASNALGAFTVYATMPGHAISVLMYPSRPVLDVDRDGEKDAVIIIDTAHYSIDFIESRIDSVDYMPPLMSEGMPPGDVDNLYLPPWTAKAPVRIADKYPYVYMRVVDAVLGLPDWLKAPWIYYALEKSNYTWYVEKAWNDTARYCLYRKYLEYWANWTEKNLREPLYVMPPSMALALKDVLDKIPVVYEAGTPPLREVKCTYQPGQSSGESSGETSGGNQSSNQPLPAEVSLSINATWDGHEYRGNITVGNTTIVVIIYKTGTGEWVAEAWVNKEYAYSEPIGWSLKEEVTLYFTYEGTSYKITVHIVKNETGNNGGTINATIQLTPVYTNASTPWGQMPVFKEYVGTAMVNQTNITVIAVYSSVGKYSINVYVNGSRVYGETNSLPTTIAFKHDGVEYELRLEIPKPPVLNQTIEPELVPVNNVPIPLPNGTVINITIYKVNETIRIGNTTVAVIGFVSRLGIDIDIYVFGVPPAKYSLSVTGLEMNKTVEYNGALQIHLHYRPPENKLIPETTIKITIQQLNLTIEVENNG